MRVDPSALQARDHGLHALGMVYGAAARLSRFGGLGVIPRELAADAGAPLAGRGTFALNVLGAESNNGEAPPGMHLIPGGTFRTGAG